MMKGLQLGFVSAMFVVASACASIPAAPDMAGAWSFRVDVSAERTTEGELVLQPAANGYTGTLTTNQGANVLPVQSFVVAGESVEMVVVSPDGAVTFEGILSAGGQSFSGAVTYHDGQRYPLAAVRVG